MVDAIFWAGVSVLLVLVGFLAGYTRGISSAEQLWAKRFRQLKREVRNAR